MNTPLVLAVQSVFHEPLVSASPGNLGQCKILSFGPLESAFWQVVFCFVFYGSSTHVNLTNSVINFCNHLLTGLLASTLAPPEFILLRFYCWGLSISLICIYQNYYKKDKTIFWWGQMSQTFQNPSWSRPCRIGNQRWRNLSVHAYPTNEELPKSRTDISFKIRVAILAISTFVNKVLPSSPAS